MKMAGPDIILLVIGALLFSGAGYGLVATGGGLGGETSATGVFEVTYTTRNVDVGEQTVANLGGTQTLNFDVTQADVTKMTVKVACSDTAGAVSPFNVVVTVAGPNGLSGEGDGSCGSAIEVAVKVADVPPSAVVQGRTEAEAHDNMGEHHDGEKAVGEWAVTLNGARGAGGGLPVGNPGGTVTLTAEHWVHELNAINV